MKPDPVIIIAGSRRLPPGQGPRMVFNFLEALPAGPVLAEVNAKESVADVPRLPLPAASRRRRKTGFLTPVGRWIREQTGGDANVSPEQEKEIRRKLVEKALETLRSGKEQA